MPSLVLSENGTMLGCDLPDAVSLVLADVRRASSHEHDPLRAAETWRPLLLLPFLPSTVTGTPMLVTQ